MPLNGTSDDYGAEQIFGAEQIIGSSNSLYCADMSYTGVDGLLGMECRHVDCTLGISC
jgi:hypothetical protein